VNPSVTGGGAGMESITGGAGMLFIAGGAGMESITGGAGMLFITGGGCGKFWIGVLIICGIGVIGGWLARSWISGISGICTGVNSGIVGVNAGSVGSIGTGSVVVGVVVVGSVGVGGLGLP